MLELIVFTENLGAVGAMEESSTVLRGLAFALHAGRVLHGTGTGVCLETGQAVAHPGFTEVTNRALNWTTNKIIKFISVLCAA